MTKRIKLSKWAETAFQTDWEIWRAKTNEGMVVLGKIPDGTFTLHRFNDEGGNYNTCFQRKSDLVDLGVST